MTESRAKKMEPAFSFFFHPEKLPATRAFDKTQSLDRALLYSGIDPNDRQFLAIQASFDKRLSLLWGPPGTGKTWTLALLICSWLERAIVDGVSLHVCVGAANYNALDNVLIEVVNFLERRSEKFSLPHIDVIRLRSASSEPLAQKGVTDVSWPATELKNVLESKHGLCVVGGTFLQLLKLTSDKIDKKKLGAPWFDLLVIDEASQVPTSMGMAYATMLRNNGHFVICGDDKQLGPVQQFTVENSRDGLLDCLFSYFKNSQKIEPSALALNYRSNDAIAGWPSERFYENDYESVNKSRRLYLPPQSRVKPVEWPLQSPWSDCFLQLLSPEHPISVVTYADSSSTVSNQFEASVAASLIRLYFLGLKAADPGLTVEHFWTQHAGLVTPHRAQIATIRNLLGPDLMPQDGGLSFIDTVDRFQGQERDLIVACYTVSDPDFIAKEEAFILDARRFNVTLTRARSKVVFLASQSLLSHLPHDSKVAANAAHLQLFTSSYCRANGTLDVPYLTRAGDQTKRECEYFVRDSSV
jgi:hypothetical protein